MLKFDDFAKLEMRIGTVVSAERAAGSDKLLIIMVDLGNETRQVVAGFGHLHSPESLVGKQVPIVVNIEPAMIRGVESNGIFMALDDENATLLVPQGSVANGTKIK